MVNKKFIIACFFMVNVCVSYSQLDKGLISSYYFSGNANDSVSHINGSVRGANLSSDRFGNAYSAYCFDGINDYINLGTNTDLRQRCMSISLWVKINSYECKNKNLPGMPFVFTRVRPAVQYYEAYVMALEITDHRFGAAVDSPIQQQIATVSSTRAEINKWYNVVFMFDTDTTYLYVNSKLEQKNFKGFVSNYSVTDSVVLGFCGNLMPDTFKYQNYSWLNGCLDDIKFYNRLLTPNEVNDLYHESNSNFVVAPAASGKINVIEIIKQLWYIPLILILIIVLIIFTIRWRINYFQRKEKERNDLQQKFAQMEMKALRSQMNPHFIFNAINSIQHYVLTNEKELANKYLVKFSQLMRNILDLSKQELISLKDELETVKLYLDIESLRFSNAFSFSINISDQVFPGEIRLPPLLIQPFVENAIWHGLLLKEGDKRLQITAFIKENDLVIEIDDNGIGRDASQKFNNKELKRRSFGMDITNDRLSVLHKVFGISISFYVLDKKTEEGLALGTTVFINIKL